MGIDYLDILSRIEKELGIEISRGEFFDILNEGMRSSEQTPPDEFDFRVRTFVAAVEKTFQAQKPNCEVDVFQAVKKQIVAALMVDEDEVTPDAWMIRDLGMS